MFNISKKEANIVFKRSEGCCEGCHRIGNFELHHIFFRSQYLGNDRDLNWNLANLCYFCHRIIHHSSNNDDLKRKKIIDYKLKSVAFNRYKGDNKESLFLLLNRRKV